jgi:hypothetical protein
MNGNFFKRRLCNLEVKAYGAIGVKPSTLQMKTTPSYRVLKLEVFS